MAIWKTKWGWKAEFMFKRKRYRAKGFFKYKDEAKLWVKREKDRKKATHQMGTSLGEDISLWTLSQKYLKECEINYRKKTFGEKKYCLERFYKYVGNVQVTEITSPVINDFLNERADSQSNNAANKDRKNLKAFYSWVGGIYGILYDPTGPIKMKRHSKKARRLIPIQDVLKVQLVAEGQDRVLIGSYWHTGARKGEILRWTWDEDINFEERWVRLGTRKNRSGEMTYEKLWMNDDLYKLLKWQWDHRHPTSPYVFCHNNPKSKRYGQRFVARWKLLKSLCKKAGVEAFNYHDIRHTVAKYLNDLQKVGLKRVQQVMRHRRQTTTEIYVEGNYNDSQDVMKLLELEKVKNSS